jgi:diacylglycerol kinase family enzyme
MTLLPPTLTADRAPSTTDGARGGRAWAWAALLALAMLAAVVVLQALSSLTSLALLLVAAAILLFVAPVVSWFALTTRSAGKRLLSLAVAAVAAAVLVVSLIVVTLVQLGGLLVMLMAGLAFRAAARRAVPRISIPPGPGLPPPARPWILVNPWSGGGTAAKVGLAAVACEAGFDVHVLESGDDPAALARRAVAEGADALAVAGGDGTLAQVAAVAVETDRPFLCVPAGTRNHFARDLGLDRSDPLGALRALHGPEIRVDAAFVGDRLFLNNVSLGAYADVVAEPRYRAHKLDTSRVVVRRLVRGEREPVGISVRDADGRLFEDVQVLQVSNNRYQVRNLSRLGARERLDSGFLQISALLTSKGSALAGLAVRAAVGRLRTASVWAQWDAPALTVESHLPFLAGGVDGESVLLETPLELRVVPKALRILVPPRMSPWAQARRRRQALPDIWRLALGRDRARTGGAATIGACPPPSGT